MAAHTYFTPEGFSIRPTAKLEKKFHWFRTFYQFTEIWPKQKITFLVSPEKCLSAEDIATTLPLRGDRREALVSPSSKLTAFVYQ